MSDQLQKLHEHREGILLAEMGALLHDIGKLSSEFIDQKSSSPSEDISKFAHETAVERSPNFVDRRFVATLKHQRLRRHLIWPEMENSEQIGAPVDLITYHDRSKHSSFLIRLLHQCDVIDSTADKGMPTDDLLKEARQPAASTFVASAFGYEPERFRIDLARADDQRRNLSRRIADLLSETLTKPPTATIRSICPKILQVVEEPFVGALGETRRAANDVTLWDHGYSVATLYKTALASFLLTGVRDFRQHRWRLLRVNVDVLALYVRAVTIADLLGYRRAVEEACSRVKQLVEEEYPLGNEVYRDTTGIYFTYPDRSLIPELEQRVRAAVEGVEPELAPRIAVGEGCREKPAAEQLKTILADQREAGRQDAAFRFGPENAPERWTTCWQGLPEGRWEVCPICRLRPMREGARECQHCHDRRHSRIQTWRQRPSETIWLDEIADHNGRLALIVARFGLDNWLSGEMVETMLVSAVAGQPEQCVTKNPSPARLRRVWRTTQAFWDDTVVKTILADHPYAAETRGPALRRCRVAAVPDERDGWIEGVPYDGTIDGRPISLLWRGEAQRFITISNLQMAAGKATSAEELIGEWKERQVIVAPADSPRDTRPFTVQEVIPEGDDMGRYTPSLPLVTSPDQFLALVPAHDAVDLAQRIVGRYGDEFARVRNRLPLFLGLVFFPRKLPLQAVIDTAQRMLAGVRLEEEPWLLASAHDGCLTFENGVSWTFPRKMGDGSACDLWYPYVTLEEGAPSEGSLYFRGRCNRTWVHVKDLQAGERVRVYPSRFAYTFLDNTAQRFLFDPDKDVLLLEELPRLRKMWSNLRQQREVTDTKLQGVAALFEAKRREWRVDEASADSDERRAFRELAEATLARELLAGVTPDDVLNGRFHHCLQLHLHILRARVMAKAEPRPALDTTQPTEGWPKGES
jgi:hypothetical protein